MKPSSGTWFHSLQATSQALQPMHTVGSVKNPTSMLSRTYVCRRWFALCVPSPIMELGRDKPPDRSRRISQNFGVLGDCALPFYARSFFSLHRVASAGLSFSERPFFWMQNRWPTLWRIFVKKFSKRGSMRQTSRDDVAGKCLGFHDRDIGFAGNGKKIVRGATVDQAGCPKVIWHGDLVQCLPV